MVIRPGTEPGNPLQATGHQQNISTRIQNEAVHEGRSCLVFRRRKACQVLRVDAEYPWEE
eukprot:353299-Chlamydomonas_euryale.AAC.21